MAEGTLMPIALLKQRDTVHCIESNQKVLQVECSTDIKPGGTGHIGCSCFSVNDHFTAHANPHPSFSGTTVLIDYSRLVR